MDNNNDGWKEWSKHVLRELERLTESNESLRAGFENFKVEITRELAKKSEVEALQKEMREQLIKRIEEIAALREECTRKITDFQTTQSEKISKIENLHSVEIATLKNELSNKAGVWGAIAGGIPAFLALILIAIDYLLP